MNVGPYEVLGPLGRGAAGVVYRCREPGGREVAVKVLLGGNRDRESRARFAREVRLQGALGEAEGFVPVLDAGEIAEGPYVVMPLVAGGTLRARLAHGHMEVEDARDLGIALASALARAHERGVVHRDLKPENVLFTRDGRPLVSDLGLAKHWSSDSHGASATSALSKTGELRGTLGYMAPEQADDSKHVGPPADVFSLGAILYEALAGEAPFAADNPLEVIGRTVSGTFEPLRRKRPDAPAPLVLAIERALSGDPARRYADAGALARALELRSLPRRWPRVLAGLVLLLLLGGAGLLVHERLRPETEEELRARAFGARRTGNKREAGGDRKAAEALYREAVTIDPTFVDAWLDLARNRALSGDVEGALGLADEALRAVTDLQASRIWNQRGAIRWHAGDRRGALEDFGKALALEPFNVEALMQRGAARGSIGDYPGALADLDQAVKIAPRLARAYHERSMIRVNSGDLPGALADASEATVLEPRNPARWKQLALLRTDARDRPGAIEALDKAIELAPKDHDAVLDRVKLHADSGRIEEARAQVEKLLEAAPGHVGALIWRSTDRVSQRDLQGALADAEVAVQKAPDDAEAWRARGSARLLLEDNAGAAEDYTKAIELKPKNPWIYVERGNARLRAGDRSGAILDFEKGAALAPPETTPGAYARKKLAELEGE